MYIRSVTMIWFYYHVYVCFCFLARRSQLVQKWHTIKYICMIYTRETRSKIRFDSTMIRSRYNKIVVIHVYIIYIYTYIIYIIYTCTLYIHIYMYVYIYVYTRWTRVTSLCNDRFNLYGFVLIFYVLYKDSRFSSYNVHITYVYVLSDICNAYTYIYPIHTCACNTFRQIINYVQVAPFVVHFQQLQF